MSMKPSQFSLLTIEKLRYSIPSSTKSVDLTNLQSSSLGLFPEGSSSFITTDIPEISARESISTNLSRSFENGEAATGIFLVDDVNEKYQGEGLTLYEKQVIVSTFKEAIEELNVMKNFLPYPKFDWGKAYQDFDVHLSKISGKITESIFPPYYEYEKSPLWKIQIDRYILQKILEDSTKEININGTYTVLVTFLDDVDYVKKQEEIIVKENVGIKKIISSFKKIVEPKLDFVQSEYEIEDICSTEDEIMLDEKIRIGIEERYIDKWEQARRDQNTMLINREEDALNEKLETLSITQKIDDRIHNEISSFLLVETTKLEDAISEWTIQYNKELEIRDTEILHLKSEEETILNTMKHLVEKFIQRGRVIEELANFFEELRKEKELRNKQIRAASLIQYWWRVYLAIKKEVMAKKKPKKGGKKQ